MRMMQNLQAAVMDRRRFCSSIAGFVASAIVAKPLFAVEQMLVMANAGEGFVIVNGWVLTREDVAASNMIANAV